MRLGSVSASRQRIPEPRRPAEQVEIKVELAAAAGARTRGVIAGTAGAGQPSQHPRPTKFAPMRSHPAQQPPITGGRPRKVAVRAGVTRGKDATVEALKRAQKLKDLIVSGPGLSALELADVVSGGHIKEAAKVSDELFGKSVDEDTRSAALMGLDLARLNDARFRVVLELIDCILEVQDELDKRWSEHDEAQRPELRDLQAAAALVATGYGRQQSHRRRQVIVDALRGSFCPEPYLWGFQDELLRDLISAGITDGDLEQLRRISDKTDAPLGLDAIHTSPEMESYERLAVGGFASIRALNGHSIVFIRLRTEAPPGGDQKFFVRRTHKGSKLLVMIDAGRALVVGA